MWKNLAVFSKLRYTLVEAFLVLFHAMFFGFWRYQTLNEFFLVWLPKLFRTGPDFCWSRKVSLKTIKFCQFLCTLGKRFSHIGQKLFRQCSRLCIVRVQPIFRMKIFSGKNIFPLFLWLWATKSKTLSYIFLSKLLMRVILRVQKTRKKATKWENLRFSTFFGVFGRKIYALCPKSLRQCFQTCVLRSQKKALEEIVFKKI